MPIYCYEVQDDANGCPACRGGFELSRRLDAPPVTCCPTCRAPVRKVVVPIRVGRSQSGLDDRAKAAGFTKLKRLGQGEYERQY